MFSSLFPGLINGLLGTGGGILAVTMFRKQGLNVNQAHAHAIGLMLPLSIISLSLLLLQNKQDVLHYWPLIFPTLIGALVGSRLLKKITPKHLRLLFTVLILYSAVHILTS